MRALALFLACLSLVVVCHGQSRQKEIDSLRQVLGNTLPGTEKVQVYLRLAQLHERIDSALALGYVRQGLSLSTLHDHEPGIFHAWLRKGYVHMRSADYLRGVAAFEKALDLAEEKPEWKVKALGGLSTAYYNQDNWGMTLLYYQQELEVWNQLENRGGVASLYNNMGMVLANQGKFVEALANYKKGLTIRLEEGDTLVAAGSYHNIGVIYEQQGDYAMALDYYLRSLIIREEGNDSLGIAICFKSMADIYHHQGQYNDALAYALLSLDAWSVVPATLGRHHEIAGSHTTTGLAYHKLGNTRAALQQFQDALEIGQKLGSQAIMADSYHNMGTVLLGLNELPRALDYLQQALVIRLGLEKEVAIAETQVRLGEAYLQIGNLPRSVDLLNQAVANGQRLGTPEVVRNGARLLVDALKRQGNYEQALEAYALYDLLKDSLHNDANTRRFTQLTSEYAFAKERDSLALARQTERALLLAEINRRRAIQQGVVISLVLALSLTVVLFLFYRYNRRTAKTIKASHNSLEHTLQVVQRQSTQIMAGIHYAQRIQQAILPSADKMETLFPDHFVLYKPRDVVSGDFYWVGDLRETAGCLVLVAADCTGHGVPGAFMSMVGNELLNSIVRGRGITAPNEILYHMHNEVELSLNQAETLNTDGMDMAVVVIDLPRNTLSFAGARQALVYIKDGEMHLLKGDSLSIGGEGQNLKKPNFTPNEVPIGKGISFYLYSDGFPDQFGGVKGKKFMAKRLRHLFLEIYQQPLPQQKQLLTDALDQWMMEEEQVDDILVLGVKLGAEGTRRGSI